MDYIMAEKLAALRELAGDDAIRDLLGDDALKELVSASTYQRMSGDKLKALSTLIGSEAAQRVVNLAQKAEQQAELLGVAYKAQQPVQQNKQQPATGIDADFFNNFIRGGK